MKCPKRFLSTALMVAAALSLTVSAYAADYSFTTEAPSDYYPSSSYEDVYGSQYNYGGPNVVDYQIPELEFGILSTTQTGIMEKALLPGLQGAVAIASGSDYGINSGTTEIIGAPNADSFVAISQPTHTNAEDMVRSDGSIGTLKIPTLGIDMKVWEGETSDSMQKGLGHYSSTSAWDGNVALCGHNRGAHYVIGNIKDLEIGDTITYTTVYGTRTYAVSMVKTISSTDWSYLQSTADNRITLTTCLADQPEKRVCVQAVEVS